MQIVRKELNYTDGKYGYISFAGYCAQLITVCRIQSKREAAKSCKSREPSYIVKI
jgi:hypothetical protein